MANENENEKQMREDGDVTVGDLSRYQDEALNQRQLEQVATLSKNVVENTLIVFRKLITDRIPNNTSVTKTQLIEILERTEAHVRTF